MDHIISYRIEIDRSVSMLAGFFLPKEVRFKNSQLFFFLVKS